MCIWDIYIIVTNVMIIEMISKISTVTAKMIDNLGQQKNDNKINLI